MIKFALCDDNVQLLSKLKEILELIFLKHDFDASVVYYSSDTNNLLDFLSNNQIDVLFLDIDFHSKHNGIDIAKTIRKNTLSLKNLSYFWKIKHQTRKINSFYISLHQQANKRAKNMIKPFKAEKEQS